MSDFSKLRVGQGYDVHRLVEGRRLILGGVHIPSELGLLGHSDADALLHAITDALLGACALGDIGTHFADTDPAFKDADSAGLLARVVELIVDKGFRLINIDSTVICQGVKLAPHRKAMEEKIAEIVCLPLNCVNVKAKTNERLGYLGRNEAIEAQAAVLVMAGQPSEQ